MVRLSIQRRESDNVNATNLFNGDEVPYQSKQIRFHSVPLHVIGMSIKVESQPAWSV